MTTIFDFLSSTSRSEADSPGNLMRSTVTILFDKENYPEVEPKIFCSFRPLLHFQIERSSSYPFDSYRRSIVEEEIDQSLELPPNLNHGHGRLPLNLPPLATRIQHPKTNPSTLPRLAQFPLLLARQIRFTESGNSRKPSQRSPTRSLSK